MRMTKAWFGLVTAVLMVTGCKGKPSADDIAHAMADDPEADLHQSPKTLADNAAKTRKAHAAVCEATVLELARKVMPADGKLGAPRPPTSLAALAGAVPFTVRVNGGRPYQATRINAVNDVNNDRLADLGASADAGSTDCAQSLASAEAIVQKAGNMQFTHTEGVNEFVEADKLYTAAVAEYKAHLTSQAPPAKILLAWNECDQTKGVEYQEESGLIYEIPGYDCTVGFIWVTTATGEVLASVSAHANVVPTKDKLKGELTDLQGEVEDAARKKALAALHLAMATWK